MFIHILHQQTVQPIPKFGATVFKSQNSGFLSKVVSKVREPPKFNFGLPTLITLLRIQYLGQIGSTKLVLPKWHKHGTLNRVIRVGRWFKKVTKHPDVIYKWTLI